MLSKLFIRTWFGPLPHWYDRWCQHIKTLKPYGFDFLVENDLEAFRARCKRILDIDIDVELGSRKAGDFDPSYGLLFAEELTHYDFWGHCGLDVVFGRIDHFLPDERLAGLDVFGNDPNAICGPFSLYRNCDKVNRLFMREPMWREILETRTLQAFDENHMTRIVREAHAKQEIEFKSDFLQSHDTQPGHDPIPRMSLMDDGTLFDEVTKKETMMFHFHRFRQWPIL